MNRRHSAGQSTKAVNNSKQHGFNNISIDLIYGLPTMTNDEWKLNLDKAMELNIQHISAYHLTIEKGTVFSRYQQKGIINEIDEDTSDKQFRQLVQVTTEAGFEHYEISNFAINKYYSRHNSNYWKQVPYLGIGPSAHSYNLKSRYWNISHNRKYIESIITGKAIREVETLDSIIRYNEYLMTSLRTKWGIDLQYVEKEFGAEKATLLNDRLLVFINQGIAFKYGSTIRLTSEGFFISDKIISDLFVH